MRTCFRATALAALTAVALRADPLGNMTQVLVTGGISGSLLTATAVWGIFCSLKSTGDDRSTATMVTAVGLLVTVPLFLFMTFLVFAIPLFPYLLVWSMAWLPIAHLALERSSERFRPLVALGGSAAMVASGIGVTWWANPRDFEKVFSAL